MSKLNVRIERLPALRVARTSVRSENPEQESLQRIMTWADNRGIAPGYRLFGYDNCQPHPNHIYTTWLTVGPDVQAGDGVDILNFPGGLFAVMRVTGAENIAPAWQTLVAWARKHRYQISNQPGLEEVLNPVAESMQVDLYLPLVE